MSVIYINKLNHKGNFTQVCNPLIDNDQLSRDARFLMFKLLRQPPGHRPTFTGMQSLLSEYGAPCGKKLLNRVLRELRERGFAKLDTWQNESGRFQSQYYFSEFPYPPIWGIEPPGETEVDQKPRPIKPKPTDPLGKAFSRIGVSDPVHVTEWMNFAKVEFSRNYSKAVGGAFRFGTAHSKRLRELLTCIILDFKDEGHAARAANAESLKGFISGRLRSIFKYSKLSSPANYTPAYLATVYNDARAEALSVY